MMQIYGQGIVKRIYSLVFLAITVCIFNACTSQFADSNVSRDILLEESHHDSEDTPTRELSPIDLASDETKKLLHPLTALEESRQLWYDGYSEEEQRLFETGSVDKNDAWRMWRGRMFVDHWHGADLGLAGENISALLIDNDDIWAGTWAGGLIRLSEPLGSHTVWDPGLPSLTLRTVNRIFPGKNTIWILRHSALERYDKRSGKWISETGLPVVDRLQDFCIIGDKSYLATLGHGLWVKEQRNWRRIAFPGLFINRLEKGEENELLIGTMDRGVYRFDTSLNRWEQPPEGPLRTANITSLMYAGGLIVGGTYGEGAFIWNTQDSGITFFNKDTLGDLWVLSVGKFREYFVFGTFGTGLNLFHTVSGEWDRIGIAEGILTADIVTVAEDRAGNIWAGTLGGGIIKVSRRIYGD